MENTNLQETVVEVTSEIIEIAKLEDGAKLKDVVAKLNEIIEFINKAPAKGQRDRGPESTREMTDDDARRILIGDLAQLSHKDAAKSLGLSYGQIYSARKGFTFKNIYKEWRDAGNK